jgi:hypothetical protein
LMILSGMEGRRIVDAVARLEDVGRRCVRRNEWIERETL